MVAKKEDVVPADIKPAEVLDVVIEVSKLDKLKADYAAALDAVSAAQGALKVASDALDAELNRIDAEERAKYGSPGNKYIHDVKAYQDRQRELRAARAELSPIDQVMRQKRATSRPTGVVNTRGA